MIPASVSQVTARIAEIQSRIGVAAGFQAVLQGAAQRPQAAAQGQGTPAAGVAWGPPAAEPAGAAGAPPGAAQPAGGPAAGRWADRLPQAGKRWASAIETAARRHGIDPPLLAALVRAESNFNPSVTSHAGAIGLAQLMPGTARGLGVDPRDPLQNLEGGARYLRQQLDRFGSKELALAAYNAGPNRVARAGGIPNIRETQNYVPKVMGFYRELTS